MNGVEILNEYAAYTTPTWFGWACVLAFIGVVVFATVTFNSEHNIIIWISFAYCVICLITLCTLAVLENNDCFQEYSHTELKVTIDDSVSMNEFLNKYEILDQEGKIYTVKERE